MPALLGLGAALLFGTLYAKKKSNSLEDKSDSIDSEEVTVDLPQFLFFSGDEEVQRGESVVYSQPLSSIPEDSTLDLNSG